MASESGITKNLSQHVNVGPMFLRNLAETLPGVNALGRLAKEFLHFCLDRRRGEVNKVEKRQGAFTRFQV